MYQKDYTLTIIIWTILLSPLLAMYLRRWWLAFYGMILYLPLNGIIAVYLDRHPLAIQAVDFLFIIPAYLGFIPLLQEKYRYSGIPRLFSLVAMLLVILVCIQVFNPSPQNPGILVGLVGIKVWLFYIPLLMLTYVHVSNPKSFITTLRLINLSVWAPALFGIAQWWACNVFGYRKTMEFLFAEQAESVTMSFSAFNYTGGMFYRIPSSFQTAAHYGTFLIAVTAFCYMSLAVDRNTYWKLFNRATMVLILIASFLCGIRTVFIFVPLTLALAVFLHKGARGMIKLAVVLVVAWLASTSISGLEFSNIAERFGNLAVHYSTKHAPKTVITAAKQFPLGNGTGTNTVPARHVLKYLNSSHSKHGLESYYAKAIVELGVVGGLLAFFLLLIPILTTMKCLLVFRVPEVRAVLCGALAYLVAVFVLSSKGQILDQIPTSIFYWMMVGISFRVNSYIEAQKQAPRTNPYSRLQSMPAPASRADIPQQASRSQSPGSPPM